MKRLVAAFKHKPLYLPLLGAVVGGAAIVGAKSLHADASLKPKSSKSSKKFLVNDQGDANEADVNTLDAYQLGAPLYTDTATILASAEQTNLPADVLVDQPKAVLPLIAHYEEDSTVGTWVDGVEHEVATAIQVAAAEVDHQQEDQATLQSIIDRLRSVQSAPVDDGASDVNGALALVEVESSSAEQQILQNAFAFTQGKQQLASHSTLVHRSDQAEQNDNNDVEQSPQFEPYTVLVADNQTVANESNSVSIGNGLSLVDGRWSNFRIGPVDVAPKIASKMMYTDNLLYDNSDKRASAGLINSVDLQFGLQNEDDKYALAIGVKDGSFFDSDQDDYRNHYINVDARQVFNERNSLELRAGYQRSHQPRGVGFSEGDAVDDVESPDQFLVTNLGARYLFGAKDAPINLQLEANYRKTDYLSRESYLDNWDNDRLSYRAELFYRMGGRTVLQLEYRNQEVDYGTHRSDDLLNLASTDDQLLVGFNRNLTEKTRLSAKVGMNSRRFADSSIGESTLPFWEVELEWKPRTYSHVNVKYNRGIEETYLVGNYLDQQVFSAKWDHSWNNRLGHQLSFIALKEDYDGSSRQDDNYNLSFDLNYRFSENVDVQLGYRNLQQNSTRSDLNFDVNELFLQIKLGL